MVIEEWDGKSSHARGQVGSGISDLKCCVPISGLPCDISIENHRDGTIVKVADFSVDFNLQ